MPHMHTINYIPSDIKEMITMMKDKEIEETDGRIDNCAALGDDVTKVSPLTQIPANPANELLIKFHWLIDLYLMYYSIMKKALMINCKSTLYMLHLQ